MGHDHSNPKPFDETWWKQRLRECNLRATGPRVEVVRVLASSPTPMTAQEVLDETARAGAAESADRVTVYRTLSSLVEAGLAHRMDPGDRVWRFGLVRACGDVAHEHNGHAHFVCDACGVMQCLDDATINVSLKGKGEQRLRIKQQDVFLHGTCESCQDEEGTREAGGAGAARAKPRR